jgi:hypothetical protein
VIPAILLIQRRRSVDVGFIKSSGNCCGPYLTQNNLSAFAASVKFSLPSDIQAVRKMRDTA